MVHSPLCRNSDYHSIRKKSKRKKKILVSGGSNTLYWIPCDDHGPMDSINRHQKVGQSPEMVNRYPVVVVVVTTHFGVLFCICRLRVEGTSNWLTWRQKGKKGWKEKRVKSLIIPIRSCLKSQRSGGGGIQALDWKWSCTYFHHFKANSPAAAVLEIRGHQSVWQSQCKVMT